MTSTEQRRATKCTIGMEPRVSTVIERQITAIEQQVQAREMEQKRQIAPSPRHSPPPRPYDAD